MTVVERNPYLKKQCILTSILPWHAADSIRTPRRLCWAPARPRTGSKCGGYKRNADQCQHENRPMSERHLKQSSGVSTTQQHSTISDSFSPIHTPPNLWVFDRHTLVLKYVALPQSNAFFPNPWGCLVFATFVYSPVHKSSMRPGQTEPPNPLFFIARQSLLSKSEMTGARV